MTDESPTAYDTLKGPSEKDIAEFDRYLARHQAFKPELIFLRPRVGMSTDELAIMADIARSTAEGLAPHFRFVLVPHGVDVIMGGKTL